MKDTRFTTTAHDSDELLSLVDIDEIADLETLLMILFERPIGVDEAWDDDGAACLEVIVRGKDETVTFQRAFPLSVIDLARACAVEVNELGPYDPDSSGSEEGPDIASMGHDELVIALQMALGQTRVFNMLDAG